MECVQWPTKTRVTGKRPHFLPPGPACVSPDRMENRLAGQCPLYLWQTGFSRENYAMDKDRVIGLAKVVKGKVKVAVDKVIGDTKPQSEGEAEKVEGKVQNAVGGIKDTIRDT